MYPSSLLAWIGGSVVVLALLGLVGAFAWWLDGRLQRHIEREHVAPSGDDDEEEEP